MFDIPTDDDFEQLNEFLSECLRRAILDASKHYRENNYGHEPHAFASDMRLRWKNALKLQAEIYGFKILEIGGGSFCLVYQNYTYRFYKSSDGRVPPPEDTDISMSFYNANGKSWPIQRGFSEPGWEIPSLPPSDNTSLIMYYDYNDVDGWRQLNWLKIACPRFATLSRVDCFWIRDVDITMSSESTNSFKRSTKERDDLSYTLREDVVISPEELDEDGASINFSNKARDDITYDLRNEDTTQAEAEKAEDTSNEEDNGTSTRQIE